MGLTLYFVRHGQTDYSRSNRFCGSIDPPLNDVGLRMAEALATRAEKWDAIVASPMLRTRQTAAPTAQKHRLEAQLDDRLREIAYGEWEGRAEADVEREDGERFHAWAAHPGEVAPPGGENARQIAARAMAAIDDIRSRISNGRVLIVSHKATIRVMVCALLGIDVDQFRARIAQPVGAITIVTFKPSGPLLERLGDTSHLPADLLALDGT